MYIIFENDAWSRNIRGALKSPSREFIYYKTSFYIQHKLDHIIQRFDGSLLVTSGQQFSVYDFPSFNIRQDYDHYNISNRFRLGSISKINGLFQGYDSMAYLFYNNHLYMMFNQVTFQVVKYGYIEDIYPNLPSNIDRAFSYIDGNIYFLKGNIVYIINYFTKNLIYAGQFNLKQLDIGCLEKKYCL